MSILRARFLVALGAAACQGAGGDYPSVPDVVTDGDLAWSMEDPPEDGEHVGRVTRVGDEIWVLGRGIRRFDGAAWSDVPLPDDAPFDEFFRGAASDGASVWTAGRTLRRLDGTTWTDVSDRMPEPVEAGFNVAYDLVQAPDGAIWAYRGEFMDRTMVRDLAGTPVEVAVLNHLAYPFDFLSDGTLLQGAHFGGDATAFVPGTWEQQVAYVDTPWVEVPEGVVSWSIYGDGRVSLVRGDPLVQGGLTEFASVPAEAFGLSASEGFAAGSRPLQGDATTNLMTFAEVVDIAPFGDVLVVLLHVDVPGYEDYGALIEVDGTEAHLLPDRFAWRPAAAIEDGDDLLVVARNGAVFRGSR